MKTASSATWQPSLDLPFSHCLSPLSVSWLSLRNALPPPQGHYAVIAPAWGSTCDAIVVRAHLVACNAPMKLVMKQVGSRATFTAIAYLKAGTCMASYGTKINWTCTLWESALSQSEIETTRQWDNNAFPKELYTEHLHIHRSIWTCLSQTPQSSIIISVHLQLLPNLFCNYICGIHSWQQVSIGNGWKIVFFKLLKSLCKCRVHKLHLSQYDLWGLLN